MVKNRLIEGIIVGERMKGRGEGDDGKEYRVSYSVRGRRGGVLGRWWKGHICRRGRDGDS